MHLDEELGQRLLHRELPPAALAELEAHLRDCAACRSEFERLRREEARVFGALRHLDHPARPMAAAAIREMSATRAGAKWAAGVALALGLAGAAYAMPGSPVGGWIQRLIAGAAPMVAPAAPVPAAQAPMGGIAVAPGPRLEIVFREPAAGSQLTVRLTSGSEVAVRAPAESASYSADGNRLRVEPGRGPVAFEVDIPLSARRVDVRVGRRVVFSKDGGNLVRGTDALTGTGPFVVPLTERGN